MKRFLIIVGLLVLVPIIFSLMIMRIPPSMIGVKQSMWGGGGIVKEDFPTGFHLGISGYHKWHLLPAKTHFVHFTSSRSSGTVSSVTNQWEAPLKPRTKDNNIVTIDVSVAYQIKPEEAHRIVEVGALAEYRDQVRSKIRGALLSQLAQLTSEDFQSTEKRLERAELAIPVLNQAIAGYSCEAKSVLIRRISFSAEYEQKLQDKQFLRQMANLDRALTLQAEEEKKVNMIDKKIGAEEKSLTEVWGKRLQEKKSEYEVIIAQINADAEIYAATTRAEGEKQRVVAEANGQLAVEKAEALRNELRTAALNSDGGDILLGLVAAENLQLPKVTLNSDDPAVPTILNLDELTKMLVGTLSK
jgi:regulator of protease activity HflC (stomatin/prohibitin superfamily)